MYIMRNHTSIHLKFTLTQSKRVLCVVNGQPENATGTGHALCLPILIRISAIFNLYFLEK